MNAKFTRSNCNKTAPFSQRVCLACKGDLQKKETLLCSMYSGEKVNPYSRFTPTTSFNEISAIGGESQIKNPNSFKNVRAIVRTIASQANIKLYSDSDKES